MNRKILMLGSIWPEPQASAASTRVLSLVEALLAEGYALTFSADGNETSGTEHLRRLGVTCVRIAPNDSAFDQFAAELQPVATVFDRFTTEEKFSWRVQSACPDSIRILDTIDLHFLREARQRAFRAGHDRECSWADLLAFAGDVATREIASIYRSDLSLVVSDYEIDLLTGCFGVPAALLQLCRLVYPTAKPLQTFGERSGYVMIGTFRHPPNEDAVYWMHKEIWPLIRRLQPAAEVHIWGAHAAPKHLALTSTADGFYVHGYAPDQFAALANRRVNLAPLRWGAGIKGKIADGWWCGTPTVSTPIGSEGMHEHLPYGGLVASQAEDFARAAVQLHETEALWNLSSSDGLNILSELYSEEATTKSFLRQLSWLIANRDQARLSNFTGQMLWQQGLRCTEYFSRWIEVKNRLRAAEPTK